MSSVDIVFTPIFAAIISVGLGVMDASDKTMVKVQKNVREK